MHPSTTTWLPPWGLVATTVPAGVHWDAVRAPAGYGYEAVQWLGAACGAVIGDSRGGVLYWLVATGGRADWDAFPASAEVRQLSVACWVTVPGTGRFAPPGPYWVVPHNPQHPLTDDVLLHAALTRGRTAEARRRAQP